MAKVFLANPPHSLLERYGSLAPVGATLPHLGLLSVGAVLRDAGHEVRVVDAPSLGMGYSEVLEEMRRFQPDLAGLTAVTSSIENAGHLGSMIKQWRPSLKVVVGGPHVTALPSQTLAQYDSFDYAVLGEGEQGMAALVSALCRGEKPSEVPGVAWKNGREIHLGPPASHIADLDTLPFPAWDLLDGFPHQYRPALFRYRRLPAMHIVSSRGCPNLCIFCDTSVFGRKVRFHSAEYVLGMIRLLVRRYGVREILFEDDQFLLKRERVAAICEGILTIPVKVSWSCNGRVNSADDVSLLRLMRRSGCWQISYGIESADQGLLDAAGKCISIEEIRRAVHLTHEAGILSKGFFMLGLPGETEQTMEKAMRFAMGLPLGDISVFMLTPFPGSAIYRSAAKQGGMEGRFRRMNVLSVVYVPEGLTEERLLRAQKRFMRSFYLRPRIMGNYLGRLLRNPAGLVDMARAFYGFLSYVARRGGETDALPSRQG